MRVVAVLAAFLQAPAMAQDQPFAPGWTLQTDASSLRVQSVKNVTVVESNTFATFSGVIAPDGKAVVRVLLDSIDTGIDLRNVRMRFLFFETFQHPEAVITAQLTAADLAGLETARRKTLPLTFTLDLHGVTKTLTAETVVTLLDAERVAVASAVPISIAAADFALDAGIAKLEEAAGVKIIPSGTVTFDFVFQRDGATAVPAPVAPAVAATTALEPEGDLDTDACAGRFEILSRANRITFTSGNAQLTDDSRPLLDSLAAIIARCPELTVEVAGHTDADGSEAANLRLSQRRAEAVTAYLVSGGIAAGRLRTVGHGESRPVATNDDAAGKARNRRIEFAVING